MRRVRRWLLFVLAVLLGWAALPGDSVLLAQAQNNQQRYNEMIRSAQRAEWIGYILAGAGILIVAAAIPLGIYLGRKKKAPKAAASDGWRGTGGTP